MGGFRFEWCSPWSTREILCSSLLVEVFDEFDLRRRGDSWSFSCSPAVWRAPEKALQRPWLLESCCPWGCPDFPLAKVWVPKAIDPQQNKTTQATRFGPEGEDVFVFLRECCTVSTRPASVCGLRTRPTHPRPHQPHPQTQHHTHSKQKMNARLSPPPPSSFLSFLQSSGQSPRPQAAQPRRAAPRHAPPPPPVSARHQASPSVPALRTPLPPPARPLRLATPYVLSTCAEPTAARIRTHRSAHVPPTAPATALLAPHHNACARRLTCSGRACRGRRRAR